MNRIPFLLILCLSYFTSLAQSPVFVVNDKGKYGYIDATGNYIIQPVFEYAGPFYQGYAVARKSGKFGLINEKGEFVVNPVYDNAIYHAPDGKFTVSTGGKWGVIDVKGNIVLPFNFLYLSVYNEGYIVAVQKIYESKSLKGKACPLIYNDKGELVSSEDDCDDELYFLPGKFNKHGLYSIGGWPMVREGKLILAESDYYEENIALDIATNKIRTLSGLVAADSYYGIREGLLAVNEVEDGFINRGYYVDLSDKADNSSYKVIFDYEFDNVHPFFNGVAAIERDKKWSFINREGEIIGATNLSTDLYRVGIPMYYNGLIGFFHNKKAGYVDLNGNVVIPFQFDEYHPFEHEVTPVKHKGKYGLIRKDGSWAVQPAFKDIFAAPCPCYK